MPSTSPSIVDDMALKKTAKKRTAIRKNAKPKSLNGKHVHSTVLEPKAKAASDSWEQYAGMFANDAIFESVIENIAENRKQRRLNPDLP